MPSFKILTLALIFLLFSTSGLVVVNGAVQQDNVEQAWPYSYLVASSDPSFKTPDWVKNAIFYQIFTDRFRDGDPNNNAVGDGFSGDVLWKAWSRGSAVYAKSMQWGERPIGCADWFGGDLKGVEEKAHYLADLGINAIWFNPIMDSTDNHGYTVIDYKSVNRYFGTHQRSPNGTLILDPEGSIEVFKNMTAALDEYGIHVVLDGVFNHCSPKNKWFDRDHDFPTDGAYESQASEWYSWFKFYDWPDYYQGWWNLANMPEVMETPGFKNYVYGDHANSVLKFWDDLGVDGWRLDVAPDVSHQFWREFRVAYKELNPEGYIVGELWGDASSWLRGDEFDSTMNYRFRDAVLAWAKGGRVSTFNSRLLAIKRDYPEEAFYACMNLLDSHDTERALTIFGNDKNKMKLAVIFQMTYPGAPVIYYGDEVGMTGGRDPDCRRSYPWPDLNFTTDQTMFEHYKKLIEIRKRYSVLRTGSLTTRLVDDDNNIYVLVRVDDSSNPVAVLIYNNGKDPITVSMNISDLVAEGTNLIDVLNQETYTVSGGNITVQVDGLWASILIGDSVLPPPPSFFSPTHVAIIAVTIIAIAVASVGVFLIKRKHAYSERQLSPKKLKTPANRRILVHKFLQNHLKRFIR